MTKLDNNLQQFDNSASDIITMVPVLHFEFIKKSPLIKD